MFKYIVRRYYADEAYDETGVLTEVDDVYNDYEEAKMAYASTLVCYGDNAYEIALLKRLDDFFAMPMASSRNADPYRVTDCIPRPAEECDFDCPVEAEDDDYYVIRAYYDGKKRGLADDFHTSDEDEAREWVWERLQNGFFVEAENRITGSRRDYSLDDYAECPEDIAMPREGA